MSIHRAFKEWAVSCEALQTGRQILLVRKGGIREEGGVFRIADPEFCLLPTYEHQDARLLQPELTPRLQEIEAEPRDPRQVVISSYAVVDTILEAKDEAQVNGAASDHIWNAEYVRQRFDFNPYDPLYLLVLRIYNLPALETLPMRPDYAGCRSWVTLERSIAVSGATPALSDADFFERREKLLKQLGAA